MISSALIGQAKHLTLVSSLYGDPNRQTTTRDNPYSLDKVFSWCIKNEEVMLIIKLPSRRLCIGSTT